MSAADEKRADSTWGMTEAGKQAWHDKHGDATRKANAKAAKDAGIEPAVDLRESK